MDLEERDRTRRLRFSLAFLSFAGAAAIWAIWIQPLDTQVLQGYRAPDYLGGCLLLVPLAPVVALVVPETSRKRWLWAAATLLMPAVLAGVAIAYKDELSAQREGREIFSRYTHRFPPDELAGPRIEEQTGTYVTVCADQRSREPTVFCIELIADLAKGEEVQGGYRYHVEDLDPEFGRAAIVPFDCFGDSIDCEAFEP